MAEEKAQEGEEYHLNAERENRELVLARITEMENESVEPLGQVEE